MTIDFQGINVYYKFIGKTEHEIMWGIFQWVLAQFIGSPEKNNIQTNIQYQFWLLSISPPILYLCYRDLEIALIFVSWGDLIIQMTTFAFLRDKIWGGVFMILVWLIIIEK